MQLIVGNGMSCRITMSLDEFIDKLKIFNDNKKSAQVLLEYNLSKTLSELHADIDAKIEIEIAIPLEILTFEYEDQDSYIMFD